MADEQRPDKMREGAEAEEGGKKKSKTKMLMLIVLILIIAAGGGSYLFFGKKIMQKLTGKPVEGTELQAAAETKKKETVGPILSLEPFVFNMSGNQSKYAKVTVGLEVKDIKVEEETKKMVPVIRDKILGIFGTKTPEALMDVKQRNAIKEEVQTTLKALFKEPEDLKAVYITDIIVQ